MGEKRHRQLRLNLALLTRFRRHNLHKINQVCQPQDNQKHQHLQWHLEPFSSQHKTLVGPLLSRARHRLQVLVLDQAWLDSTILTIFRSVVVLKVSELVAFQLLALSLVKLRDLDDRVFQLRFHRNHTHVGKLSHCLGRQPRHERKRKRKVMTSFCKTRSRTAGTASEMVSGWNIIVLMKR